MGAVNKEDCVPGEGPRAIEGNMVEGVPGRAMRRTVCQGGQQGGCHIQAGDKDNNAPGRAMRRTTLQLRLVFVLLLLDGIKQHVHRIDLHHNLKVVPFHTLVCRGPSGRGGGASDKDGSNMYVTYMATNAKCNNVVVGCRDRTIGFLYKGQ